jgi:hypothetical protein
MSEQQITKPNVDLLTLVGLVLLTSPFVTMAHELGGHAAACLALGGHLDEIGAYYVSCESANLLNKRLVSMAGTASDVLVFAAAYWLWLRARSDLMRLTLWVIFIGKGMAAAGYLAFSGVSGIGDWAPGIDGGIGPLPHPYVIRAILVAAGVFAYIKVIQLGKYSLMQMVGGAPDANQVRRTITMGYYWTAGFAALAVGMLNPKGIFIVLASAMASSFGGNAGIFSIAHDRNVAPARPFSVTRNWLILLTGITTTAAFAAILGPSIVLK